MDWGRVFDRRTLVVGLLAFLSALAAPSVSQADVGLVDWSAADPGLNYHLAEGPDGAVWLTNDGGGYQSGDQVHAFTQDGDLITSWGKWGYGADDLQWPNGIALALDGHVYVTEPHEDPVSKFTTEGHHVALLSEFRHPSGMDTDPQGNIYVANTGGGNVKKISPDGQTLMTFSETPVDPWGNREGMSPSDVAIDGQGNVLAVDEHHDRLFKYSPDGELVFVRGAGGSESFTWSLADPQGVEVDPEGNIYVADTENSRVKVYRADGELVAIFSHGLSRPKDLLFTASGHILATGIRDGVVRVLSGSWAGSNPLNDRSPPDTKVASPPCKYTIGGDELCGDPDTTPTFRFVSNEPASTFECKRDRRSWKPCSAPRTYGPLSRYGLHEFRVRATDSAGNLDPSRAFFTWKLVRE